MLHESSAFDVATAADALRLELGLQAISREQGLTIAACPRSDLGALLPEIGTTVAAAGTPAVIWVLETPQALGATPHIIVLEPAGAGAVARLGLTLWAPSTPGSALLIASPGGGVAYVATRVGMCPLPRVPVGEETTTRAGEERASARLLERAHVLAEFEASERTN